MRWPLPNSTLATLHRPSIGLHRLRHIAAVLPPASLSLLGHNTRTLAAYSTSSKPKQRSSSKKKKRGTVVAAPPLPDRRKSRSRPVQHADRDDHGRGAKKEPIRRLKLEFDDATIRSSLTLPTRNELPQSPRHLLTDPADSLRQVVAFFNGTTATEVHQMVHDMSRKKYMRAITTVRLPGQETLEVPGDGIDMKAAKKAADLHAIAKLHALDLLRLAWPTTSISAKELKTEKNGITEVFNYAARYGCIPSYTNRHHRRGTVVHLEMPEHEIKVDVHTIGSLDHAEAAASREFKAQAELYHKKMGADMPAVDERAVLTAANATQFFDYCRDVEDDAGFIEVIVEQDKLSDWTAYAIVDGQEIGSRIKTRSGGKKTAANLAYLTAALSVVKDKPQLWQDFQKRLIAGNGNYLSKVPPKDLVLNTHSLLEMQRLNQYVRTLGRYEARPSNEAAGAPAHQPRRRLVFTEEQLAAKSNVLEQKLQAYKENPDLAELRNKRYDLPMSQYAPQVREIVDNNIYSVIIGATGSGKTTQVPQILLDQAIENGTGASCNVVCTQPRRIAATSVARRVADERGEQLQDTVGYQVRFDSKLPKPNGSITYCTTGILLQQLQHEPDQVYDHVSHLVIDEVHERDIIIDFLLIILKKTMAQRAAAGKSVPRVILMSATIDAEQFSEYFKNSIETESHKSADCPTLSVPGRTFPVKEQYLEDLLSELRSKHKQMSLKLLTQDPQTSDYLKAEKADSASNGTYVQDAVIDWKRQNNAAAEAMIDDPNDTLVPLGLVATTIAHIASTTSSGAILAFLPGLDEIVKTDKMLREQSILGVNFNDQQRFRIFLLHSSIPDAQKSVFDPVPEGCRKIVLSTNIAETSVTIPDVQHVIDTGKSRETRYDQLRRITSLQCGWISKSNAKQRAGRAGRVQNGNYYALYTSTRAKTLRAIALPELLRSDLQEVCLDVMSQAFRMPVREFLAEAIEPPSATAVDAAMLNLADLGAITPEETLTPLGRILASLPVHPSLGKMIILGIIFKCLDPMIILGAAAAERSLFVQPLEARAQVNKVKYSFAKDSESDHLMLLKAFRAARQTAMRTPRNVHHLFNENFIHGGAYRAIDSTARQIEEILTDAGLAEARNPAFALQYGGPELNQHSGSDHLIKALLFAGLYPNIAIQKKTVQFRMKTEKNTFVHPSSVNSVEKKTLKTPRPVLTFSTLALSADGGRMNMRDVTVGSPLMPVLLAGKVEFDGPTLVLDDWLPFFVKTGRDDRSLMARWQGRLVSKDVLEFRQALDKMLENAFNNLVAKKRGMGADEMRNTLADGLVKLLTWEAEGINGERSLKYIQDQNLPRGPQEQVRFDLEQARFSGNLDRSSSQGRRPLSSSPPTSSQWSMRQPQRRFNEERFSPMTGGEQEQGRTTNGRALWQRIVQSAQ